MSIDQGAEVAGTARGRRLPRRERRAQLLVAAREVFVTSGYHAAAMDDIAEHAGVSKPVLYQHFPSKLDLYLALLDAGIESLIDAVKTALESTTDNKLRVTATMDAYFAFVSDPAGAFRLVFESDLTNESAVRDRTERADDACAQLVSHVIAADTGLTDEEALLLAAGLTGIAQTAARHWLRSGGQIPEHAAAKLVSSLGWRGISGFPLSHPVQHPQVHPEPNNDFSPRGDLGS
jgi:AcrR family transcriptional regulator